ncbi:alpha/beta fold hydrolase [Paraburkholderia caballeronis]|uniref:3-oxoadipate enol-lactonase n=1 Tax=Paraburkholderia caballeronis TaxID=416943 RepID=A0A1H7FW26_9BURK|nr:alpha/beta fold hydrolase [Paraburkholderia caballeronis]PXW24816.1 3-oxoadipate enol-lactonase [Paraburkholderia caballeronis]PXX00546.1 3-oxoadipate enol-lactonase [Paraburkholderia caballeronis]RAJ98609.1 3-oxoadipate enol-lactonase [Paraburkholderia caballeronis]SEE68082.1 3-oxoadipate enol-lactonase [Paraburkholderia caballeronis]SEK30128.1 3-oxoadipate enol-lactonase [Paraburkholderia caballeronis]
MPWCNASGVSIRYEVAGSGDRPLLLAHELGGSLRSWDAVVAELGDDFTIVRWDQRGSGLSEKTVAPYDMRAHVDDLEAVRAAAGISGPCFVGGVAAGAAIAVIYAASRPADCEGLILCAPALGVDPARRGYLLERANDAARAGMRAVVERSLERSYPPLAVRSPAAYHEYRARFLSNDPVSYGLANAALASSPALDLLASVDCPAVVAAGRLDMLRPPEQVKSVAAAVAGGRLEVLDCGHIMQVQAPLEVATLIRTFAGQVQRKLEA